MKLYEHSAAELSGLLRAGQVSAVEVVQSFIQRADRVEPLVRAFITRTPEMALDQARAVDEKMHRGEELHPLAGVPVAIKDNISTEGLRTTCASRILENYVPPYDATVTRLVKNAGMPLLGKTNMDEFAMGSSTENSAFFPTGNPWNLQAVPGGSSGGSAAAVSAGMAPLALGSDTGGSIRQPAALCGLVGLRPTYGRVSRYGLIAFASSLDQVGPLALDSLDAAMLTKLLAGQDPLDSTSLPDPVPDYPGGLGRLPAALRIGVVRENVSADFDSEVNDAVLKAVSTLEDHGASVGEVSLPLTDYGLGAYYLIAPSEASSNLGRYDGVRYGYSAGGESLEGMFSQTRSRGFGPEVKRRIMIGTYALSAGYYDAYYLQAMKVRTLIRRAYSEAFNRFDLLVGAASPTPAFMIGDKVDDPLQMYLSDICNITDALAGLPSLAVPCALHSTGLPLGLQLTAPPLGEKILFQAASFLELQQQGLPRRPSLEPREGGGGRP